MTIAFASLTRRTRDPEPSDTSTPSDASMAVTSVHLMFAGVGFANTERNVLRCFVRTSWHGAISRYGESTLGG